MAALCYKNNCRLGMFRLSISNRLIEANLIDYCNRLLRTRLIDYDVSINRITTGNRCRQFKIIMKQLFQLLERYQSSSVNQKKKKK